MIGRMLGPYRVLDKLGAGGMGEVYRACDTRLDRTVAIKVLPPHLADTPDARQRFEREARAVSALNHPHICTLYDVGQQDGIDYLVMECVEGETLAARLARGPLPLPQVLRFGADIADALDHAHRSGVVHRDLKPGNIMLTTSGAKLLDFGLVKAVLPAAPAATPAATATHTPPVTQQGTIVGTFQYMSPEQLEGKDVDTRSDIFAFGAVLYEMVTGRLAFPGKSQLSVASAVMEKDPEPVSSLQPSTPPALDRAIRVCLAKDPEDRWQTARDLLRELTWIAEGGSQVTPSPASAPTRRPARWRHTLLWGSGSLLLAAIAGLVGWNLRPPTAPPAVTRAVIALPPGQRLAGLDKPALALSRDGTELVYVATQDGVQRLYLRAMDSLEARPIPGTEGAVNPFFSPDGQWLGFFAGQKLKRVPVSGGAVLTLGDVADPEGASWSSQGIVAFAPSTVSALLQVHEGGGPARPLTRLDNEATHRWPTFLRDGQAVLFAYGTATGNWEVQHVAVQSVETGERRNLIRDGAYPAYAPSGHVVYAQRGNLMAVPFDAERLTVTGAPVPVVEGVLQASTGASQYSISASGSLVYVSGGAQSAQLTPVWVTRDGVEQPVAGAPARGYAYPRLSPDGLRLAVGVAEPDPHVFVLDLTREVLTRLTRTGTLNALATWTPDGQRVVFTSDREGPRNLYWQRTDGSGEAERLTTSPYNHTPMSWSPDGQILVFGEINHPDTGFDIWQLRISDRTTQPVICTAANESTPRFSPDGRWLAYASDESGRQEIYVQPYPGPGGRWQVSADGGREPVWNPNGRELFYRSGDKMMVADIATQPGFSSGRPRLLFEGPYEPTVFTVANYDVSPDGRRFLMLRRSEHGAAAPTQINVVLNWADELTRRVPAKKP